MPIAARPLFRPDVLRAHLSDFVMPVVDSAMLAHSAERNGEWYIYARGMGSVGDCVTGRTCC